MRIVRGHNRYSQRVTEIKVDIGLPPIEELQDEFIGYMAVFLGRDPLPPEVEESPYLGLREFADVVYARAGEVDMLIHWGEQNRQVPRGHPYYRFRTGQLRTFMSVAKRMSDLGSRRLSEQKLLVEQQYDAGEVT
jgi:hypothetical protein